VSVELAKSPKYATSEASDSGWNTTPATYLASGCSTLSPKDATLWKASATKATVTVGSASGPAQTGAASILYRSPPQVTTQPRAQSAQVGGTVTFTAAATGLPTPTVGWQYSTDEGKKWTSVPGAFRDSRTTGKLTAAENGRWYRAVFTNTAGITPTKAARLTVTKK
jgi:hypothetical protein